MSRHTYTQNKAFSIWHDSKAVVSEAAPDLFGVRVHYGIADDDVWFRQTILPSSAKAFGMPMNIIVLCLSGGELQFTLNRRDA